MCVRRLDGGERCPKAARQPGLINLKSGSASNLERYETHRRKVSYTRRSTRYHAGRSRRLLYRIRARRAAGMLIIAHAKFTGSLSSNKRACMIVVPNHAFRNGARPVDHNPGTLAAGAHQSAAEHRDLTAWNAYDILMQLTKRREPSRRTCVGRSSVRSRSRYTALCSTRYDTFKPNSKSRVS